MFCGEASIRLARQRPVPHPRAS